jgi:hypothetical protein
MMPKLPEPNFKLIWRGGQYLVSKPNIDGTDVYTPETVRAIQEEAYKAGMAAAVPDGWKVVPVEPTIAMCLSGAKARLSIEYPTPAEAAYIAMLSAAPEVK